MVKAVIFDLDDTLLWDYRSVAEAFEVTCELATQRYELDSHELEQAVRKEALALYPTYDIYAFVENIGIGVFEALWGEFKDEGSDAEKLREMVPVYRKAVWTNALKAFGVDDEQFAKLLEKTFSEERRKHIYLYDDTLDVLNALKGKYKIALLTNGSPDLQNEKLKLSPELVPYFDQIVISGDFGEGKPAPSIFYHVLELLDVEKEEAIMVGDNPNTDIRGAEGIGMTSVWINHHEQTLTDVTPTYEIKELKELLAILKK